MLLLHTRKIMQANVSGTAQPLQRSRQVRKRSGALHSGGQSRGRQMPEKAVNLGCLSLLNAARRGPVATYTVRCCVSMSRSWRILLKGSACAWPWIGFLQARTSAGWALRAAALRVRPAAGLAGGTQAAIWRACRAFYAGAPNHSTATGAAPCTATPAFCW